MKLPSLRESAYTLLKFRSAREDVTISRVVEAALSRIENSEQLVAVGGDFTMEGLAMLEARGAIVVRLGEFGWTDDRYVAIHSKQRAH